MKEKKAVGTFIAYFFLSSLKIKFTEQSHLLSTLFIKGELF